MQNYNNKSSFLRNCVERMFNPYRRQVQNHSVSLSTLETVAPVQQNWLFALPWKMQTVINQALRAPDTHFCPNTKIVCRWMRSVVLNNADREHTFMCRKQELPSIEDIENELNYCSMHFTSHFLYGLEIIGYKHPDPKVAKIAYMYYSRIVTELFHFEVESRKDLEVRLADNTKPHTLIEFALDIVGQINPQSALTKTPAPPKLCPTGRDDNYTWGG